MAHVFIIAGETSGDLHAAGLVAAMTEHRPDLRFTGIGGDRLMDEGVDLLHHCDQLSFMGFAEVVRHLPYLIRVMGDVRSFLTAYRPDLVILVDYPGFNLRVAREAKSIGIPVLYYIAPQAWAWHQERVRLLSEVVDRLACVLPFEEAFFQEKGEAYGVRVPCVHVGHPLVDAAVPAVSPQGLRDEMLWPADAPILALLPGSRRQEVRRILPRMIQATGLLRREFPELLPVLCAAPGLEPSEYDRILARGPLPAALPLPNGERYGPRDGVHIVRGRNYDILSAARGAFVASGTATLETALLGTPMVVTYRMNPISWWIGRHRVKVPHVGLVNLVAGERIVPELLQGASDPRALARALASLLREGPERSAVLAGLTRARAALGEPGAAERTAHLALGLLAGGGPA